MRSPCSLFSRSLLTLGCLGAASALSACAASDPGTDPTNHTSLRLERQSDGSYQSCDESGACQSLPSDPSTSDCAILEIRIDLASGETCQSCEAADGTVLSSSCDATLISCTIVTIPDPDCLVCAYVNGAIVYSNCIADPDPCDAADCAPGTHCEREMVECFAAPCPPHVLCVPDDPSCSTDADCGPGDHCVLEACTEMACADGSPNCNNCFGHCEPIDDACAAVDCGPGYLCKSEIVECFAAPCPPQAVCEPVGPFDCDLSHALCDMATPLCDDGQVPSIVGSCYGPCVPADLCGRGCQDDSQCAAGEVCQMLCPDCAPDAAGSTCACTGTCVPSQPDPCAAVDCAPGYHCEAQDVVCITEPCPPQATCVPDACRADADCSQGERCVLDACTEMACPDTDPACNTCTGHCEAAPTDCVRTGCSGQLCAEAPTATTCEWSPSYACFDAAICERGADGACGWRETDDLKACLAAGGPGM